jgi:hypothetical protein
MKASVSGRTVLPDILGVDVNVNSPSKFLD